MNNYTPKEELETRVFAAIAEARQEGLGADAIIAQAAGVILGALLTVTAELRDAVLEKGEHVGRAVGAVRAELEDLEVRGDGIQGELENLTEAVHVRQGTDGVFVGAPFARELVDGLRRAGELLTSSEAVTVRVRNRTARELGELAEALEPREGAVGFPSGAPEEEEGPPPGPSPDNPLPRSVQRLRLPGDGSFEDGVELASHLRALRDAIEAQQRVLPIEWKDVYSVNAQRLVNWLGARIAEADRALQGRRPEGTS